MLSDESAGTILPTSAFTLALDTNPADACLVTVTLADTATEEVKSALVALVNNTDPDTLVVEEDCPERSPVLIAVAETSESPAIVPEACLSIVLFAAMLAATLSTALAGNSAVSSAVAATTDVDFVIGAVTVARRPTVLDADDVAEAESEADASLVASAVDDSVAEADSPA